MRQIQTRRLADVWDGHAERKLRCRYGESSVEYDLGLS